MNTEFEAAFLNINPEIFRKKLREVGADNTREEYLQKRITLELPQEKRSPNTWLRVRNEGDKITFALKGITGDSIEDQKELMVNVDDFEVTVALLETIGCITKSFQESKRELWMLDEAEVTIDTWPFLDPYVEIEGISEEHVKDVSEKLGFNFSEAKFCSTSEIYKMKYGKTLEELPKIVLDRFAFDIDNPFE